MEKMLEEIMRLIGIQKKLDSISQDEFVDILQTIPIPTFEEYCSYRKESKNKYDRVYKKRDVGIINLDETEITNFKEEYLQFVRDKFALSKFFKSKYSDLHYKYQRDEKLRILRKEHTDEDLIKVYEIIFDREISGYDLPEILEELPKPSEEEYCKRKMEVPRPLSRGVGKDRISDEQYLKDCKAEYRSFIKNIYKIRDWYESKENIQKIRKMKMEHINDIRNSLIAKGVPEVELDKRIQIQLENENKKWEENSSYYHRDKYPWEENDRIYKSLQEFGDYNYLSRLGLLPNSWDEP